MKVAPTLFIEVALIGKDKKTQFDVNTLGIVDDEEVFWNYNWSFVLLKRLLHSLKTFRHGKKDAHTS